MGERMGRVEELLSQVDALRAAGKLPEGVTREGRISFVYGNCKLSNPDITREMVEAAVDGVPYPRPLYLQPMTHGDARYAAGRRAGRSEGFAESALLLARMASEVANGAPVAGLKTGMRPVVVSAYIGASRALHDAATAGVKP